MLFGVNLRMDSICKGMEKISEYLRMLADWVMTVERMPLIYAAEHKGRSSNPPTPLLGVLYQAEGQFDEWIRGDTRYVLPRNWLAVGAAHHGSSSSAPRGDERLWAVTFNVAGHARFDSLWKNPWFATAPVHGRDRILAAFQAVVTEFAYSRATHGYRLKAAVLNLFAALLDDFGCKDLARCRPLPSGLESAQCWIQTQYANPRVALADMARAAGMSPTHFCRAFRHATGSSPMAYMNAIRIERARALLATTALRISEVAAEVGYEDPLYFSKVFHSVAGQTPSEYRRSEQRVYEHS